MISEYMSSTLNKIFWRTILNWSTILVLIFFVLLSFPDINVEITA